MVIHSKVVALPNEGPLAVIPFEAGAFVTTTYTLTFEDGLLTRIVLGSLFIFLLKKCLDRLPNLKTVDDDEIPRLHEAYRRALVRRFDDTG